MGVTVIGGSAASGDSLGTHSNSTETANSYQTCTLDLSTGNTFVLDDIYSFPTTHITTSNAPASGTLGKYDVFLPAPVGSFAAYDNTAYDSGTDAQVVERLYTLDVDAKINAGLTSLCSFFFTDNGKILHVLNGDNNQSIYQYDLTGAPYDLSYLNNGSGIVQRSNAQLAGTNENQVSALTDRENAIYRLFHIDNNGNFFLFLDGSDVKKLNTTGPHSFAGPTFCTTLETFTPTNITDPDTAAITQDGKYLYCYDYTNDKVTNYILSNPFDLTSATYHSAATSIAQILPSYGQIQVPSSGERLVYNTYSTSDSSGGIYSRAMSTEHDLSTLGSPVKLTADNYTGRLSQFFDDETKIAITDIQSGQRFDAFSLNYIKPAIQFANNILPTEKLQQSMQKGKATKFSLVTADGGTTFTAY